MAKLQRRFNSKAARIARAEKQRVRIKARGYSIRPLKAGSPAQGRRLVKKYSSHRNFVRQHQPKTRLLTARKFSRPFSKYMKQRRGDRRRAYLARSRMPRMKAGTMRRLRLNAARARAAGAAAKAAAQARSQRFKARLAKAQRGGGKGSGGGSGGSGSGSRSKSSSSGGRTDG